MTSARSARYTELAIHLHRLEAKREWREVRTQQVERILLELDRQFKITSRLVEVAARTGDRPTAAAGTTRWSPSAAG